MICLFYFVNEAHYNVDFEKRSINKDYYYIIIIIVVWDLVWNKVWIIQQHALTFIFIIN